MVKGVPPFPRDNHSYTVVGTNLFVFGRNDGKNPLRDLHILNMTSNTWLQPNLIGEGPKDHEGHSAALVGHHFIFVRGSRKTHDEIEDMYYNDLYILDTNNLSWTKAATTGTPPSP